MNPNFDLLPARKLKQKQTDAVVPKFFIQSFILIVVTVGRNRNAEDVSREYCEDSEDRRKFYCGSDAQDGLIRDKKNSFFSIVD